MRLSAAFLIFLMLFIPVASATCGCASPDADEPAATTASGGGGGQVNVATAIVTEQAVIAPAQAVAAESVQKVCVVNTELMKELDVLVEELKKAEEAGDQGLQSALMEKIRYLKEEISRQSEACRTEPSSGGRIEVVDVAVEAPSAGGGGGGVTIAVPVETAEISVTKPTVVESGSDITDYYKLKMTKVMEEEKTLDEKIISLKELRDEIDNLIMGLIEKKEALDVEELEGVVSEVRVLPTQVIADTVTVTTTGKTITAEVKTKKLEIAQATNMVVVREGDMEVSSTGVTIENKTLKVGEKEVKLLPSEVVPANIVPKAIELKEEADKAVYKLKTDEERKLLGFIPLKVEKELTLDASDASTVSEVLPWWAFLTTE